MKNAQVPDLLYALSICAIESKYLKNIMFDNEFHLLLNVWPNSFFRRFSGHNLR